MTGSAQCGAVEPRGTNPDFASLHPGHSIRRRASYSPFQTAQFLGPRLIFFRPGSFPSSFLLRRCRPPSEGIGGAPRDVQPCRCRAVTRDATLARHGPSRATGRYASRRSAVALSAQVPPPSPLPGPARRLHATSPMGWLRCRASRVRGYRPRSTPHPAPPSGSPRESAPHERDVGVVAQARDVVNNIFITYS
jgi:hypothetical protein